MISAYILRVLKKKVEYCIGHASNTVFSKIFEGLLENKNFQKVYE
jgi:hypothetical protein